MNNKIQVWKLMSAVAWIEYAMKDLTADQQRAITQLSKARAMILSDIGSVELDLDHSPITDVQQELWQEAGFIQ